MNATVIVEEIYSDVTRNVLPLVSQQKSVLITYGSVWAIIC